MIIKTLVDIVPEGIYTITSGTRILAVVTMSEVVDLSLNKKKTQNKCKCIGVHNFSSKYCNNK